MKIAISLLTCSDENLLKPCLNSLLKSDITNYDYKLFCVDNNSKDNTISFLKSLECPIFLIENKINEGIVIPRIILMENILQENFDYTIEIHTDMLFPAYWLTPLLNEMNDNTAIVAPFILNNPNKIISVEELENLVIKHKENKIYNNIRQVHPWVLNNKIVKKIGYYDSNYSPCECEDDDFMYNVIKNNYEFKANKNSIVLHYGGLTRTGLLKGNLSSKMQYFYTKNGLSVQDMINKYFTIHPVITIY